MADRPLTGKQKKFIDAYLGEANFNASKAAIIAGYKGNGNTIGQTAHKLVNNGKVSDEIATRLEESAMTSDEVLSRLGEQAKVDYSPYLNPDGTVDLNNLLADNKGHLIKGFTPLKYGTRVEFYDGQSALNTLAKHHGLLNDRIDIRVENELESLLGILEQSLEGDTYNRILEILAQHSEA